MGDLLNRKKLILAKVESTVGTDSLPVPALDALLVNTPNNPTVDGTLIVRDFVKSDLSPEPHAVGRKLASITLEVELKSSIGAKHADLAACAPEWDPLIRACGMVRTDTAETSGGANDGNMEYLPTSENFTSCTIYAYLDGLRHIITGCFGSVSLNAAAGNFGVLTFTMTGIYNKPTDTPLPVNGTRTVVTDARISSSSGNTGQIDSAGGELPVLTAGDYFNISGFGGENNGLYEATGTPSATTLAFTRANTDGAQPADVGTDTTINLIEDPIGAQQNQPSIIESMGLTIGSFSNGVIESFSADLGVTVSENPDVNSPDGFFGTLITARDPNGSFNPTVELLATKDFWLEWENATPQNIQGQIGTAGNEGVRVTIPAATYRTLGYGDREGILVYDIPYTMAKVAGGGDDEFQLRLT